MHAHRNRMVRHMRINRCVQKQIGELVRCIVALRIHAADRPVVPFRHTGILRPVRFAGYTVQLHILNAQNLQQLQNLAGDLGVDVTGCKKKADYVDAIAAAEVNAGGMVDDEDTDGDDLPDLNAADPE